MDLSVDTARKDGYDYFMQKEIYEQPRAVRDTVSPLIRQGKIAFPFPFPENFIEKLKRIYIVACGSAFHVGMTAKYIIEDMARIPVTVDIASEFRYRNPIIEKGDLCIFISQSGETADTLASLREAKKRGAFTLSVVNVLFSTIARESDGVVYTNAGTEIAVATTKAFSAQLAVIYLLSAFLSQEKGFLNENEIKEFTDEILSLPDKIEASLECDKVTDRLAQRVATKGNVFFIGRGIDYPLCLEGSLKLKEISYIHCEGYGAGELKHGTISLIEKGTVVVAIATDDTLYNKMVSNIKEVRSRGAFVIAVVKKGTENIKEFADEVIFVPETTKHLSPSLTVVPLQLLAYHTTVRKGLDVDKPRKVLGAYGFRGWMEGKARFVESIPSAVSELRKLLAEPFGEYPYLSETLMRLTELPMFSSGTCDDGRLTVKICSFSFKKGIPRDPSGNGGGYVFDCRSIHNPGRYEPYKKLTGRDEPVIRFLEDDGEIIRFLDHVYGVVDPHVGTYARRGFTSLMVSFGCTGGQHRSVYCAEHLARHLAEKYPDVRVLLNHREQGISEVVKSDR